MIRKNSKSLDVTGKEIIPRYDEFDLTTTEKVTFNLNPNKLLWNHDFRGKEFVGEDFSGWVLHGNFDNAVFIECNFHGAAIIYQTEFPDGYSGEKALFEECNFSNATFETSKGGEFDLSNCITNNTIELKRPSYCYLMNGASIDRIEASNIDILNSYYKTHNLILIELDPSDFSNNEEIAYVTLSLSLKGYTALRGKSFERCYFKYSNFESIINNCQFSECLFSKCVISGVVKNTYFDKCCFSSTKLSAVSFKDCSFRGSVFHYDTRTSNYSSLLIPNFATEAEFSPGSVSQTVDAAPNWRDYSTGFSREDHIRETELPDYSKVPLEAQENFNTQDNYLNPMLLDSVKIKLQILTGSLGSGFKIAREDFLELIRQLKVFEIELTRGGRLFGNYLPKDPVLAWHEALSMSPNDEYLHFTETIMDDFFELRDSFLNYINYTAFVCSLDYRAYLEDFYKNLSYRSKVENEFFYLAAKALGFHREVDDYDYDYYWRYDDETIYYPEDVLLIAKEAAAEGKLLEIGYNPPTDLEDRSIADQSYYLDLLEENKKLKKLTQVYLDLQSEKQSLKNHKDNLENIYLTKSSSEGLGAGDATKYYIENYPGQFNAVFNGCNLSEVRFSPSYDLEKIVKAYFKNCELTNIMKGDSLYKPLKDLYENGRSFTFRDSVFENCNISALTEFYDHVSFENCFFGDCHFGGLERIGFDRCGFINCDMNDIKINKVLISRTWFLFTDFKRTQFKETVFRDWSDTAGGRFLDRLDSFTNLNYDRLSPELLSNVKKAESEGIKPLDFYNFIENHSLWSKFHNRDFMRFFKGISQPLTKINFEGASFDSKCSIVDSQENIKVEDYMDLSKAINPPTIRSR